MSFQPALLQCHGNWVGDDVCNGVIDTVNIYADENRPMPSKSYSSSHIDSLDISCEQIQPHSSPVNQDSNVSKFNKTWDCCNCNPPKIFKTSLELEVHARLTGHRPYVCKEGDCAGSPKTFNRRDTHVRHQTTFHKPLKDPHICDHCSQTFKRRERLRLHRMMDHMLDGPCPWSPGPPLTRIDSGVVFDSSPVNTQEDSDFPPFEDSQPQPLIVDLVDQTLPALESFSQMMAPSLCIGSATPTI